MNKRLIAMACGLSLLQGCMPANRTLIDIPKSNKVFTWGHLQIDMPKPGCKVVQTWNPPQVAFDFALNRPLPFGRVNLYSMEWTDRAGKAPLGENEINDFFKTYVPDYLAKNFGSGRYTLRYQAATQFQNRYPATYVVGTGQHAGGRQGTIYAIMVYMDHHWLMLYALNEQQLPKTEPVGSSLDAIRSLPEFAPFETWALSFKYQG